MPIGGGGMGGGYSGGPAIVPISDLLIPSLDASLVIMDLLQQDIVNLGPDATQADLIDNLDGHLGAGGVITIDLDSLLSTSSLDALSASYDAYMAGQAAEDFNAYENSVSSANWAAWHSGPTSDISNMLAYQQSAMEYSFQRFMTDSTAALRPRETVVMGYVVFGAHIAMEENPSLSFRDALSAVASAIAANPSDLLAFSSRLTSAVETVTVTAPRELPYGDVSGDIFTFTTVDHQYGVGTTGGGPPRPNVDMAQLRAEVLLTKASIMQYADYLSREYGSLIYKDAAGVLHHTDPVAGGEGAFSGTFNLPIGSVVVAWIHDHPEISLHDQREPSGIVTYNGEHGDWWQVQQFLQSPYVDPGLMTYILDDHSGLVFEYGVDQMGNSIHPGDVIG